MPRGRLHSRSRSRTRSPKGRSRRRRSRSRSSSGSPHYQKKRKSPGRERRYSQRSSSPKGRRYSQDGRDRKYSQRSASSSPERGQRKTRSPKRRYSRSRSGSPQEGPKTGGRFDSSVIGSNQMTDFDMRIRELQAGKASKFAPFSEDGSGRHEDYPKEVKNLSSSQPAEFQQAQIGEYATPSYQNTQRDGERNSPSSYNRIDSMNSQRYDRNFQGEGYLGPKGAVVKSKRSPKLPRREKRAPSSPPARKRSHTPPPIKHRKKSFSPPRHKSKYTRRSTSPKRSKESSKKSRRTEENNRKKSPPRSSRLGPGIDSNLIVIPRRKDEGTMPIFDRPEIPVYTIRDDPSLIAEGYFEKEDTQRARSQQVHDTDYRQEPRDEERAPSPTVTFRSTGLEKYSFPNSAAFFEPRKEPQIVSTTLGEIHDRMRNSIQSGIHIDQLPSSDLRLALDRKQLSPLRGSFTSDLLNQETLIYEREKMARSLSEERRPVKERLGGKKGSPELPDFRKELDMLNQTDPLLTPKGRGYFQHDDREDGSLRQPYLSPTRRPMRGGYRGRGYRGRGYIRNSFSNRGRYFRGSSFYRGRGTGRDRWTHDKFEDDVKPSHKKSKKDKDDKSSKKEKKSKKSDGERRSSRK